MVNPNSRELRPPIHRSWLRLRLGKAYYTGKRYLLWCSPAFHWAKIRSEEQLPEIQFEHKTPLIRHLRGEEMEWQKNKVINLRLAVARLDGLLLRPGETFSYWRLIGKPTRKKGYREGMVLFLGQIGSDVGGGLCQLSNLIFWMTLHTPLEVKERHRHGYDVFPDSNRTQPFGSGATCFYPYGDLMIYNPTDRPFQLRLRVGETDLEGEWRSDRPPQFRYQIVERHHEMRHEWWGGCSRHNELYLQVFDLEGELLEDRLVVENHAMMMYTPFLEDNAPDGGREEEEK